MLKLSFLKARSRKTFFKKHKSYSDTQPFSPERVITAFLEKDNIFSFLIKDTNGRGKKWVKINFYSVLSSITDCLYI